MAIKNYTTVIPAQRTISEIQEMLGEHGAQRIGLEYEGKQVAAIMFQIKIGDQSPSYRLPCRWQQIKAILSKDDAAIKVLKNKRIKLDEAHCRAVGWRIVRDWLDAQLAIIEAEMADLREVMLPYMLTRDGRTIYEVSDGGRLLLTKKD